MSPRDVESSKIYPALLSVRICLLVSTGFVYRVRPDGLPLVAVNVIRASELVFNTETVSSRRSVVVIATGARLLPGHTLDMEWGRLAHSY